MAPQNVLELFYIVLPLFVSNKKAFRFIIFFSSKPLYMQDGIMQTHDEETRRFFKHSSVQVLLCPRIAGKRHSWIKQRVRKPMFLFYFYFIL